MHASSVRGAASLGMCRSRSSSLGPLSHRTCGSLVPVVREPALKIRLNREDPGRSRRLGAGTARQLLRLVLGVAALCPAAGHAVQETPAGGGFAIEHAALRAVGGTCVVDARIDFAFNEDNLEAMRNGVALTVIVDVEVRRERGRWWDETLAAREIRYRIETNVLTGRYRVRNLGDGSARNYRSLEEMMETLGDLESIPIIARERLSDGARHAARIRARLDIESLPSPLRPIAYLSPRWRLNSGWFEWPIQ